jgi:hypothetical protein
MIKHFGGATSSRAADAAIGRGMADVLAALDSVIDDDAALARVLCLTAPAPASITTQLAPRRLTLHAGAVAAAALAAAAVALVAVIAPGADHSRDRGSDVLAAYVVQRVDKALSAADPGMIARMTVTTRTGSGATTTAQEWSYGDEWRSVTYSPAGHTAYDAGYRAGIYTVVSDATRTWAPQHALGGPANLVPRPRACEPVVGAFPLLFEPGLPGAGLSGGWLPSTVVRDLHGAVSCGTLTVAGRQRVDGNEAIELSSRPGSPISETIWVSPDTYLPVRVVVRSPADEPGPSQTADITWLRPTAQNLASIAVPIPAGFRRVPFIETVTPSRQHVPTWSAGKV